MVKSSFCYLGLSKDTLFGTSNSPCALMNTWLMSMRDWKMSKTVSQSYSQIQHLVTPFEVKRPSRKYTAFRVISLSTYRFLRKYSDDPEVLVYVGRRRSSPGNSAFLPWTGQKTCRKAANGPVWMPLALKILCLIQFWSLMNSLFPLLALWSNKIGLPTMKVKKFENL